MTPLTTKNSAVCLHKGKVILYSNNGNGKDLEFQESIEVITKKDLLNTE